LLVQYLPDLPTLATKSIQMRKLLTISSLMLASLLLIQCTPKKTTTTVMTPAQKVADVKKNYTEAQMEEGKTLWQGNCNKCHKLFDPGSRTVDKWEAVLPSMTKRAKLNDQQAGMVRAYLLSHAKMS
jgi:cytochrome c